MSDGEYEFFSFWMEILKDEKEKGNIRRVKEIENMLRRKGFIR